MSDVLARAAPPPDLVIRYGDGPDHVADVCLPASPGLAGGAGDGAPLVLFFHGGFWRAAYDRRHLASLAVALAAAGFAVCAPEYRRTGQRGGGWPGTFDDVAAAVDDLPRLAREASGGQVSARQVILGGHSAGGQLALWAASRHRLPPGCSWHRAEPLGHPVIALAAVSDLTACYQLGLGGNAARRLMGGTPDRRPDRYRAADPALLLPVGSPVRLLHGLDDADVPCEMSEGYAFRARALGDDATCKALERTGHFELIDPLSAAWPQVIATFLASGRA